MAPQILTGTGNVTTNTNAATTAVTLAKPPNTADGDTLLWVVGHRGPGALSGIPAGWTEFASKFTTPYTLSLLYKKIPSAAAETPTSYTLTAPSSSRLASAMMRCTDADALFDNVAGALSLTTGTLSLILPGLTTSKANQLLIAIGFGGFAGNSSGSPYFQTPAGMTSVFPTPDLVINSSSSSSLCVYQQSIAAAGTVTGNVTVGIVAARPATNTQGFLLALSAAAVVPSITPSFGQAGQFTAVVEKPPAIAATFGQAGTFTAIVYADVPPQPLMSYPPACILYVDGVRMADGQPGELDTDPVALDDLRVTWGRNNTLDQPTPATCTFNVLDMPGGQRFLDVMHMGSRIEVRAEAIIYPDPTVSTIGNLWPSALRNGVVTAGAGTPAATMMSTGPADQALTGTVPPLPFSSNVSAWDGVPRTLAGQSWRLKGTFTFPARFAGWRSWSAQVRPIGFTGPAGTWTGANLPDIATTDAAGNFDLTFVPPPGVWLGFGITVYPTGPTWDDLDDTTWDALGSVTWDQLGSFTLSAVQMLAPAAGALRAGSVFAGRITDMEARYSLDVGGTVVDVIAQDDTAELANRYVGDVPWAVEDLNTRFGRIVAASGQAVTWTVDPGVQDTLVSYKDVDSQPATRLLQELAQSVAGALWSATSVSSGPFLRLEDIDSRPPLQILQMGDDGLVHIAVAPVVGDKGITLSACDVLLEPVRWVQDATDASTRVAVIWKDQDPDPVKPTDRTETVIDAALETATGQRRVSVSTVLATQAAALVTADSLLGRLSVPGWRVSGLEWRAELDDKLDAAMLSTVMQILDGATRIGLPILLTDLPEWSPTGTRADVPLYLEGGRFSSVGGAWRLELVTSSAVSQGLALAWDQLPADWSWDEFGPEISWSELAGVGLDPGL